MSIYTRVHNQKKTANVWEELNPILGNGEVIIVETEGKLKLKIGDGVTAYNDLPFTDDDLREELAKKLEEIEAEIKVTDETLANSQTALLNLLTKDDDEQAQQGAPAGDILRVVVKHTMEAIQATCLAAAKQGNPSVSLISMIDIESQIQKIVEDLGKRGMFPESDEVTEERVLATQAHTLKVIKFLKELRGDDE